MQTQHWSSETKIIEEQYYILQCKNQAYPRFCRCSAFTDISTSSRKYLQQERVHKMQGYEIVQSTLKVVCICSLYSESIRMYS